MYLMTLVASDSEFDLDLQFFVEITQTILWCKYQVRPIHSTLNCCRKRQKCLTFFITCLNRSNSTNCSRSCLPAYSLLCTHKKH